MKALRLLLLLAIPFFMASCVADDDLPDDGGESDYAKYFLGTWHVYEADKKLNYDVTIDRLMDSETQIVLKNFADLGNVEGLCSHDTVYIDNQGVGDNYFVMGKGYYINSKKLTFYYTLSDGIDQENHTANFTRE